jgi:hypothetical protein
MEGGVAGDFGLVIRTLEKKKESENVTILLQLMEGVTVLEIIMKEELVQV